jgi:hypothetical protein
MANVLLKTRESVPRFAVHELAYLLATRTDENAVNSRAWLSIPSAEHDREAVQLGLSSLVARGLIEQVDGGDILPRNEAGLVGFALGTATKWITITARVGNQVDLVHFSQSESVAMMIRHAPADTIDFALIKPDFDADDGALSSVERVLGSEAELDILIRVAIHGTERGLFARRTATNEWHIGFDPVFPGDDSWPAPDLVLSASTRAEVLASARRLIRSGDEHA